MRLPYHVNSEKLLRVANQPPRADGRVETQITCKIIMKSANYLRQIMIKTTLHAFQKHASQRELHTYGVPFVSKSFFFKHSQQEGVIPRATDINYTSVIFSKKQ